MPLPICNLEICVAHCTFERISFSKSVLFASLVTTGLWWARQALQSPVQSHTNCERVKETWRVHCNRFTSLTLPSANRVKRPTFPCFTNCWSSVLYHVNLSWTSISAETARRDQVDGSWSTDQEPNRKIPVLSPVPLGDLPPDSPLLLL